MGRPGQLDMGPGHCEHGILRTRHMSGITMDNNDIYQDIFGITIVYHVMISCCETDVLPC